MFERPIHWTLETHRDERGRLVVAESNRGIPFAIRRVFWVCDVPEGETRGGHSHHACQQLLVCVAGGCRVVAGGSEFDLSDPGGALYVPPGIHLDLDHWQPGTVLLVLCSHYYDEEDYAYQVSEPDTVGLLAI